MTVAAIAVAELARLNRFEFTGFMIFSPWGLGRASIERIPSNSASLYAHFLSLMSQRLAASHRVLKPNAKSQHLGPAQFWHAHKGFYQFTPIGANHAL